jgi:hypothetical protein
MTVETIRNVLLWCLVLNYAVVLVWSLTYRLARDSVQRLWGRWFPLSPEQFDMLTFVAIAVYKIGILLFNVVPYVALWLAA